MNKKKDYTPQLTPVIAETSTLSKDSAIWLDFDLRARAMERKAARLRRIADRFNDWKPQPPGRRSLRTLRATIKRETPPVEAFYTWLRDELKNQASPLYVDAAVDAFEAVWLAAWKASQAALSPLQNPKTSQE